MAAKSYVTSVRLAPDVRVEFLRKSHKFGGSTYVLRELVKAFVENRLVINPPILFTKETK